MPHNALKLKTKPDVVDTDLCLESIRGVDVSHGHGVLRQRACLVRTDNVHTAYRHTLSEQITFTQATDTHRLNR